MRCDDRDYTSPVDVPMRGLPDHRTVHVELPPLDDDRWARLLGDVIGEHPSTTLVEDRPVVIDLRPEEPQGVSTDPSGRRSSASS